MMGEWEAVVWGVTVDIAMVPALNFWTLEMGSVCESMLPLFRFYSSGH